MMLDGTTAPEEQVGEKLLRLRQLRDEAHALVSEIDRICEAQPAASTAASRRHRRRRPFRESSVASAARRILEVAGQPMHVFDIQRAVEHLRGGAIQRSTLVSTLARYSKEEDTFFRAAENVYGLLVWRQTECNAVPPAEL